MTTDSSPRVFEASDFAVLEFERGGRWKYAGLKAQEISALGGQADTHVYFAQRGGAEGPVKIGASSNVVRRLAELQIGSPEPMRIIGVWLLAGRKAESGLHRMHAADRLAGEWFAPTTDVMDSVRCFGGGA